LSQFTDHTLAISTLLQPPIVRTGLLPHISAPASSAHKPPTSRDIPPVTLTNIPNVDPAEFRPYLTQVGALYDALQRARENEEDGGTQLLRKSSKLDDFADLIEPERRSSKPNLSRQASLASLASSIETPSLPRRKSSNGTIRRAVHAPTPLSTIPNVYFEEDFHLENPRTFDVVSERSEVVRPVPGTPDERKGSNGNATAPRKALATNAILQEKLSWYMDTIEVHLISSISTASTSFFAALGSLKDLHSEAADSVSRIKELRKELESLDQEMAIGGLNIVNKRRRKENLKQLNDAIQQLKNIVEAVGNCESLVNSGDVEKALDAIDDLEKLVAGEGQPYGPNSIRLRDLKGVKALEGVTGDIDTLRFRIGKTYESRFLNTLLGDLRRHVKSVSIPDTLQRWSMASQRSRGGHNRDPSVFPAYLALVDDFRSEILAILGGLHRAKYTLPATTAYREAVLSELRNVIRGKMPASNDDDVESIVSTSTIGGTWSKTTQEKSAILSRNLRALDPEDAEELLMKIYIGIGETLRRLGTQVKVLLDVTSTLGDPMGSMKSPLSPKTAALEGRQGGGPAKGTSGREIQEEMHQTLDMSNLLGQAVDKAQDQIVKVLKVRSEQSTQLSVERFLRYFHLNLLFANECEQVSGRSGTSLKTVVNGHIKEFVQKMAETSRQSLATGMEADVWAAIDFTEEDAEQLDRVLSASTRDAEAWTAGSKIWLSASSALDTLPSSKPLNGTLPIPGLQANAILESGRSTPNPSSSKSSIRPATIDSESFLLPNSAILCLHGLSSFLHLITGIPSMTSEIGSSIISYLALFDSRCKQLILGAGATRSAGLKNITTKHLALAAQSLAFIASLITHVREFVRRHASTNSSISLLMGEFDKIRRSFLEHQQSIFDKLSDLMSNIAISLVKVMKTVDWEKDSKTSANKYIEDLAKDTNTLHKVMTKHLPEGTVKMVMQPIFKAYKDHFGNAFGEIAIDSEEAHKRYVSYACLKLHKLTRDRMLRDAEYFKARIGGLEGAEDTVEHILNIVKEKPIPKAKAPAAPAPAPAPAEDPPSTNGTAPEADLKATLDSEPVKEEEEKGGD
jgi:vacuolar protein sorting-associated protein 54